MGYNYEIDEGRVKEYESKSVEELQALADAGDGLAYNLLSLKAFDKKEYQNGFELAKKSAEAGYFKGYKILQKQIKRG